MVAGALSDALEGAGHGVKPLLVGGDEDLDPAKLARSDALVVVGGDGTVHHAAEAAIEADTPIYHAPTGNENLFARDWGMTRGPEALLGALDRWDVARMDVGRIGGRAFLLMCSLGPDASVIHRVDSCRNRPVGHLAYALPVVAEALGPRMATVTVRVDGDVVVERRRGQLIIANSRQYALRLDPARGAVPTDGRLDVVFLETTTTLGMLGWGLRCAWGAQASGRGYRAGSGRQVAVEVHAETAPLQVDGERPGGDWRDAVEAEGSLVAEIDPGVLPVLRG